MFAGKHDNVVTRALSAPGLWMQRITTREPTLDMLEIAIISIKCALRDDFPEFKEFYELKGWVNNDNNTELADVKDNASAEEITDTDGQNESDSNTEASERVDQ